MKILLGMALLACAGCSREVEQSDPRYEQVVSVMLLDVQGLWGGQSVYLKRDGATVVQIVTPPQKPFPQGGLHEKRYRFDLGKAAADKVVDLLRKHDFLRIQIKGRPGIPDEARPTIVVHFSTGESKVAEKWAEDGHADFDAIYSELLSFTKTTPSMTPIKDGRYEEAWMPEGFSFPAPGAAGLK